MSDTSPPETEGLQAPEMPINIISQYIRDLSFENPTLPENARTGGQPVLDINIGMDARRIISEERDFLYEVVLNLRAVAMRNGSPVFVIELQYGVLVELKGIPEDNHHAVLLIEIPRLAFPYAREIVSNITMGGGYPPLLLNPVDFQALYMERFKDDIAAARAQFEQQLQNSATAESGKTGKQTKTKE